MATAAADAGADPIVVVLGANAAAIAPAVAGLTSTQVVVNAEWKSGLSSSLALGIRTVFADPACDGALVTLADQPLVDAASLRTLLAAFDASHRLVASAYNDTFGAPAVFGREYAQALAALTGDTGAGSWLRSRPGEVTLVPLANAATDVDTLADAARLHLG
jgi:molybdenum cofactor cytidylyltransferase